MHLSVCVGITDGAPPGGPDATRRFLRLHSPTGLEVCSLAHAGALGFNELINTPADVHVLLEGGALVGPGWLDHLLAALARPGGGLAGPSTNRAWNEQGCVPRARVDLTGVRRDAAILATRFGSSARSLAPLHSLGAFCYAVRRDVVDRLGPADPAYGEGPCWEMDYSARAARAGYAGLWVGAAYVHRPPAQPHVERREAELLAANSRLYQDRLCGLRLRGETDDHRPHCRGDACEHFAPRELIQLTAASATGTPTLAAAPPAGAAADLALRSPLVSCLMVTRDRPDFALQSVEYFRRQGYPNRELVIVEDGTASLAGRLPRDPRIRLVPTGLHRTIGAMRNQSCELARGEVLVLWDDDDWQAPDRLATQVQPILDGRADLTGLTDLDWLELDTWRCWRLDRPLQERLLLDRVYAGTLAFHRRVWERVARFANRSLAEDAAFLRQALARGARFEHLDGSGLYVYVRHGQNSWQVPVGTSSGWISAPVPDLPSGDLAFLRGALRPQATPLVSCVMPTMDRRPWVGQAIEYFLRQDWPSTELIVLDDGSDPVDDLIPAGVRYHRLGRRTALGAKRNLAVELANGDLIAHWDDDDWYSTDRLSAQVRRLEETGADLVGTPTLSFYDPARTFGWRYRWPPHRRPWLAGTSLMFRRDLWTRNRFAEVATGEDTRFVWRTPAHAVTTTAAPHCIAIVHPGNTVPKTGRGAYWTPEPVADIEAVLGTDLTFYESLLSDQRRQLLLRS